MNPALDLRAKVMKITFSAGESPSNSMWNAPKRRILAFPATTPKIASPNGGMTGNRGVIQHEDS
jgi:hypothetical protein